MRSQVDLGVHMRSGGLSWPRGIDMFAFASAIAAMALLPFAHDPGPRLPGLNTVFCTTLLVTQLGTAFLLSARFQEKGTPALLLLVAAHLYSSVMAGLLLLVFPDALTPGPGLIATSLQSPAWIYHFWMWGFALIVLAAVVAEVRWPERQSPKQLVRRIGWRIAGVIIFWVVLACLAAFIAPNRLPPLIELDAQFAVANMLATYGAILLMGATVALIHARLQWRDTLFRWLGAALVVYLTANLVSGWSGGRFTLGWAIGRFYWAVAAAVLFIYFLRQFRRQQIALVQARDLLEEKVAERTGELARSSALLRAVSEGTSDLLFAKDRDCRILFANPAGARALGAPLGELIGATARDGKLDQAEVKTYLANDRRVMERGEAETFEEVLTSEEGRRTYLATKAPLRDERGRVIGLIEVSRDITDRKYAEEQTKTLLLEVTHRAKNMLAVVQAMARASAREDPSFFADRFAQRLSGLAASHDLLVNNAWRGVELADLMRAQLAHVHELIGSRIAFEGAPLRLKPGAAQALGMAIHELSTNAVKYGSLSNQRGRIRLQWQVSGGEAAEKRFEMTWIERGGPPVINPARQGYGYSVIVRMVEHALDGEVRLDYRPEGVEWRLDAPARSVLDGF